MSRAHDLAAFLAAVGRRWRGARRAGYIGWLGHGNLGDEAMRRAAELLLGQPLEPLRTWRGERVLAAIGAGGGRRALPVAILGGGTLINPGRLVLVEDLLRRGVPLVALGTGVGSAGFSASEEPVDERWAGALRQFRAVGVRGPVSAAKLAAAGFAGARVVGDLALALTPDKALGDAGSGRFLVNFAPARLAEDQRRLAPVQAAFSDALVALARRGLEPVPVAFDPADRTALRALLDMSGMADKTIHVPTDFAGYQALTRQASFALGVRLHSAVFAAACGVPPLLVGYRDKCRDFCETVGHGAFLVELDGFEPDDFAARLDSLMADSVAIGGRLHGRCRELRSGLQDFADAHLKPLL